MNRRWTVTSFKYLGSGITDEGPKPETLSWIARTVAASTRLKPVCNDRSISPGSKIRLMLSLSHPSSCMLCYACVNHHYHQYHHHHVNNNNNNCHNHNINNNNNNTVITPSKPFTPTVNVKKTKQIS